MRFLVPECGSNFLYFFGPRAPLAVPLCACPNVSGGPHLLPKFMPISFFRRASRFYGVSGHLALQQGKSPLNALKACKLVSRSDLVLELTIPWSFWGGGSLSRFKARISFYRVSDKIGALRFLPYSHKNEVAHVIILPSTKPINE